MKHQIRKNISRMIKLVFVLALLGYIYYVFEMTVFSRSTSAHYRYDFLPLWSYKAILNGKTSLIRENVLNVALFMPIGLMLYFITPVKRLWLPIAVGVLLSGTIELIQLFGRRGFCEIDDILHNTIGCLCGYLVAWHLMRRYKKGN